MSFLKWGHRKPPGIHQRPSEATPLQMERWMAAQDFNQKVLAVRSQENHKNEPEEMEPISLQAIKLVEASGGKTR